MFGKRIRLFRLFGFQVNVDVSWLIIAVLITWSLAVGVFPHYLKDLSTATYWWMGVFGAVGLFGSIIFHELTHSLVARRHGMPMRGITLFLFGGVAHMSEEPPSAKAEFTMAVAGPISSILLAVGFWFLRMVSQANGWPRSVLGVVTYLAVINFALAAFNLLPAFPLDGGRAFRALLWRWKKDLKWATRVASQMGSAFGVLLIVLGVITFLTGNFIGGVWWFLLGMFLRMSAQMSYRQLILRKSLEGEPVRKFMTDNPVTVSPSLSITQLVEDYVYRHHYKFYPVVKGEKLVGCITMDQIKEVPKEERDQRTIGELAKECSDDNTIEAGTDAVKALSIMRRTQASRLMVTEDHRLVGIITLKDLLKLLSMKIDLEG
jgi:Zn-dependent protease/CBS domain-containing protein